MSKTRQAGARGQLALVLMLGALPAFGRDFLLITDPSLVGRGAGADGLWGTGDAGEGDITTFWPGANPEGAASFSFDINNANALTYFSGGDSVADPVAPIGQINNVSLLNYTGRNVLGIVSTTTLDPAFTSTVTSTGLMQFSSNTRATNSVFGPLSFLNGTGVALFNDGLRDDPSLVLTDANLITAANFLKGLVDVSHPDWTSITFELHCTSSTGCSQGSWTSKYSVDPAALSPLPLGISQSGSIFVAATNTPFVGNNGGGGLLSLAGSTGIASYEALIVGTEDVGNKGVVTVTGQGASLLSDSGIVVGERGIGKMRVSAGASLQIDGNAGPFGGGPVGLVIGNAGGSSGLVEIQDIDTTASVTGPVIIGDGFVDTGFGVPTPATGTLRLDRGAQMTVAGSLTAGSTELGSGTVVVNGAGTSLIFDGADRAANIGLAGHGSVEISDGASVSGAQIMYVALLPGSSGDINIDGSNTRVDLTGVCVDCASNFLAPDTGPYLSVGFGGNGSVTVSNGAQLTIDPDNAGATIMNGSGFEVGGSSFGAAGTGNGTGTLTVQSGAVVTVKGSTGYFSVGDGGDGTLAVEGGGQVVLENPDGLASGYLATTGTSSATVRVSGNGSVLNAGAYLAAGIDFNQADSGGLADIEASNGGTIAANTIQLGTSATLRGNGGTILGSLVNGGTVSPGASPGIITVNGDYSQLPGGKLFIEIGGVIPGDDFDVLKISGTATLDGVLEVHLIDGFIPAVDDVFPFLLAGAIEGNFSSILFPTFGGSTFAFDLDSGSLLVSAVPLPAGAWLLGSALFAIGQFVRGRANGNRRLTDR